MAITIYPPNCADFSTNGLGILTPIECTIEEYAAGKYELKLTHPIDDTLRWAQISVGCILRAPAPVRESPLYAWVEGSTQAAVKVTRNIWEVSGTTVGAYMRAGPGMNYRNYGYLKNGDRVTEISRQMNGSTTWLNVIVQKGGCNCWMSTKWLKQVGAYTQTVQNGRVVEGRSVEVSQSRDQLFRVTAVEVDTQNALVTATAQHIFYDLRGNIVNAPLEAVGGDPDGMVGRISSMLINSSDFSIRSLGLKGRIVGDYGFKSAVEALLDPDEGIVAQTGAMLIRDNYDVFLLPDAVRDTSVTVRRDKNLIGVSVTNDISGVVTRIIPEGKDKSGNPFYITDTSRGKTLPGYVDSPHINDYPQIYARRIAYDVKQVEKDPDNETTFTDYALACAKLTEHAQKEFSENGIDLATYGMDVDFVLLQEPEEYAALQAVHLYDTVTVIDELIGLKAKVRVTGYVWDALAQQYERVILGEIEELQQTVYSYNLPTGGVSGSKIALNSLSGSAMRDLSVEYAKISYAAIEQLNASSITALTARIQELIANKVYADELYASLAQISQAEIATADIDWAHIKDTITDTAIITQGEAGQLFIARLAVTEANMVSLTVGELVVKGADGCFYAVTVDEEGNIQTEKKQINNDDVTDLSINAGEKIIEGSVTAACLNAKEIFADSAIIRELIAANLDVDALFAREAFVNLLRTSKIVGEKTLELIVKDTQSAQAAADANTGRLDELGENLVTRPEFERVLRIDAEGLHVGDNQSFNEALIDTEGLSVVVGGEKYSRFASTYARFGNYLLGIHPDEGGLVISPA